MEDYNKPDDYINRTLSHKVEQLENRPYRHWSSNFGMIASLGGVIIMPILLGLWGGGYLDEYYPQHFSWRLSGLFLGFFWGIMNAYFWIKIEERKIARLDTSAKKEEQ